MTKQKSTIASNARNISLLILTMMLVCGCSGESKISELDGKNGNLVNRLTPETTPLCAQANPDPDGDGWGWENEQTCLVDSNVTLTPTELPVGIVYYIWHCITKTATYQDSYRREQLPPGEQFNTSNVLSGQQKNWGDEHLFHWWDKPSLGYYCLGDSHNIIHSHLTMLRDAGIDFLVVDITNHPNIKSLLAEEFILKSLRPLLDVAKSIPNAPKIVPWVPLLADNPDTRSERDRICNVSPAGDNCNDLVKAHNLSMLDYVTNILFTEYPEQLYYYKDKPLLLEAANDAYYPRDRTDAIRPQTQQTWTVRRTWGLSKSTEDWQFLSPCKDPINYYQSQGWTQQGCKQAVNAGEQISVSAAYQYTYISGKFERVAGTDNSYVGGMPKFSGRTLAQQFRVAFENRDIKPVVLVTGWNEWIASRFIVDGETAFVDSYNHKKNRDIEPGGNSEDYYYYLMKDLISRYRSGVEFRLSDYFLTQESIFDPVYYWNNYPDLQLVFEQSETLKLQTHWQTTGIYEGRRPSLLFDSTFYFEKYTDLQQNGINSPPELLHHFLSAGFFEGRQGSAEFNAREYINRNDHLKKKFGARGYYQAALHFIREASGDSNTF